jgi:hypothetical protein
MSRNYIDHILLAPGAPVPTGCTEVYALVGYEKIRSRKATAAAYALRPGDLPHGGWTMQGFAREAVQRIAVPVGSTEHRVAASTSRNAVRERFAEDAATFADVAHDDGGMIALYDLLEQHTALWATGMPADTKREVATTFMFACIDALAARMKHIAKDLITHDITLPWGVE